MFHVIVMPLVSAALGRLISEREALLKILNRLYDQLENDAARYRSRRDLNDPDLFDYVVNHFDGEAWHTLRFSVDDRQATNYLIVVALSYKPGKFRS
jgi:hypothetical protein